VLAAPNSNEIIGTIILGEYLDANFIEYLQVITGNRVSLYKYNSSLPEFQQPF